MGHSSDSDNDRKKRKKKKKKRTRSRSASPDSRHSHKHKKSKKTKSKHRSESRSRESSRRRSRSYSKGRSDTSETSRSYDRRRSRSRSYDRRRSRSRSYDRRRSRSRSYDRRRSRSRERYSRRLSRSTSRSRRQSVSSDHRSESRSRDRYSSKSSRRRSHDKSCERYQRSHSASKTDKLDVKEDSCASIPGFSEMTPAEQTRIRMNMALKAAGFERCYMWILLTKVAADEKLRGQAEGQKAGSQRSFEESLKFTQTVQDIEGTGFSPQVFKSSRSDKKIEKVESKEEFTFGTAGELRLDMIQRKPVDIDVNTEELANPDFFGDPEEKIQRWIQKLGAMRRKKLEGEVLT